MTGARFTVEQKVTMYFESLRPRYRPFCMYQFCGWCGKDYPRTAFTFLRIRGCTTNVCGRCRGSHRPKSEPAPWESREMMLERLTKEHGVSEDRFGKLHVYKTTKTHREEIRRAQGDLSKDGEARLRYKIERDRMAETRYLSKLQSREKDDQKENELRKMLREKWERERLK
jgi:hypothetical protein